MNPSGIVGPEIHKPKPKEDGGRKFKIEVKSCSRIEESEKGLKKLELKY